MVERFIKQFVPLGEANAAASAAIAAANQAETEYKAMLTKYEEAKKKDGTMYQSYADGEITKDAYLSWVDMFLETEGQFRRAEIMKKLAAPRGEQASGEKPQQTPGTQTSTATGNAPTNVTPNAVV